MACEEEEFETRLIGRGNDKHLLLMAWDGFS